jgi:hypothetical protein
MKSFIMGFPAKEAFLSNPRDCVDCYPGRRYGFCKGIEMTERTEWEVVDGPSPGKRPSVRELLASLLGPWWRWKVAGAALTAGAALLLVATLSGLILLLTLGAALFTLAVGKLARWLRGLFAQRGSGEGGPVQYMTAGRPDAWRK